MTAGAEGDTAVTAPARDADAAVADAEGADQAAADEEAVADEHAMAVAAAQDESDDGTSADEPSAVESAADGPDPEEPAVDEPAVDEPAAELEGPPTARLAQLGITLPDAPAPVAAYVPAVRSGDLVFTSGQLPFVDGSLPLTGQVGDLAVDVTPDEAAALARQCAVNALAAVAGVVDLDHVVRVVKVVAYVASAPGFGGQPQVANGASMLFEQVFGEAGRHTRSAVGVSALPMRSPVEVEVVVQVAPEA